MNNLPVHDWLTNAVSHVTHYDWRLKNRDKIRHLLPEYLVSPSMVLDASFILNHCIDVFWAEGRFDTLSNLYSFAISTFESDIPIPTIDVNTNPSVTGTNIERLFTEYMDLRINQAYVQLISNTTESAHFVTELRQYLPEMTHRQQLKTYLIILKSYHFGHTDDFDINILSEIKRLANNRNIDRIKIQTAICHYYFAYEQLKELEQSIRTLNKYVATEFCDTPHEISKLVAEYYLYTASIHLKYQQFKQANQYLDTALEQSTRIDHMVHTMMILLQKATLFYTQGDFSEATYWINRARQQWDKLPEKTLSQKAKIWRMQGKIHFACQKYPHAIECYQELLSIWETYQRSDQITFINIAISSAYIKLNEPTYARQYLQKAETVCRTVENPDCARYLMKMIEDNFNEIKGIH